MKKIFALICLLALICGLCACSTKTQESTLSQYFDLLKKLDYTSANSMVIIEATDTDKIDPVLTKSDFNDILFSTLTYDIWKVKKQDANTVIITVMVHQIAMKEVYSEVISDYSDYMLEQSKQGIDPTDEQIKQATDASMLKAVKANTAKIDTITVDVKLEKQDGQWKIVMDKPLLNALFGGLIEAMDELISTDN